MRSNLVLAMLIAFGAGLHAGDPPRVLPPGGIYPPNKAEAEVVGEATTKIKRDTSEFGNLVETRNHKIVFKDEEKDGSDRMTTKKAKEKLDRLADLVEKEWGGQVKLRVTEAWDDRDEHSKKSTHYEGRGVDITTSDQDKSKLDRLAGLAIEAGFEWVQNENPVGGEHVHASVSRE